MILSGYNDTVTHSVHTECEKTCRNLKVLLSRAPIVQQHDGPKNFHIFVDASDIAIGSVLMHEYETKWFCLVFYVSRKLDKVERNYLTPEREVLGLIYSINKFRNYLLGNKFTFH